LQESEPATPAPTIHVFLKFHMFCK
jgi:hypothetical protein